MDIGITASDMGNGSFWSVYAREVKAAIVLVERKLSKRGAQVALFHGPVRANGNWK